MAANYLEDSLGRPPHETFPSSDNWLPMMTSDLAELCVPDLDLPGTRAVVSAWHVAMGQRVTAGERLVEVTAGDVTVDLAAPESGILVQQCVAMDEPLLPGQVLARIRPQSPLPQK
jgi:2-oxoglutarate dehydrogenase E2 component (dihydrolipoamide succinyltransferase)/2-oxoisovalerate dehydrogenase E2 component (dihydrolipoyl transacylase)